ncbi:MAG: D-glycero-beta-D-manno-heptose 1-phosphate adenylyltransferase [Calditrichales bacterium]|nr:MAG: D-glycero-beta-D-manno-heptose 1-phosphate adenylyltransferase [Calditrichales bacterium]
MILDKNSLIDALNNWRSQNKTVVFTNGCFDILHRGHVEYLNAAKKLGDILVLGLNSDESVKRLKGETRPYVEENDRAFILSQLISIDAVVIFREDTPEDLLHLVKPDILAKGGDYSVDQVVGREIVEAYGGKVVTISLVDGRSTTDLIGKITTRHK